MEQESPLEVLTRYALEALTWHWGEAYEISYSDDGAWSARRRDGLGGALEASAPEELRQAILDDYTLRPVPRDVPLHKADPVPGTAYTAGGPRDGREVDERLSRSFPATAHCSCGEILNRAAQCDPWVHTGRMAGED